MNIPNALSLFRIILVPVFVAVFFSDTPHAYTIATAVFLAAGLTDVLDGRIARKYGQITKLGRLLDPLADKLMVFAALICLAVRGLAPVWAVALYFGKEAVQGIGGLIFYRRMADVPQSNLLGKAGTFVFYLTVTAIILLDIPDTAKKIMLALSFALIFAAAVTYAVRAARLLKQQDKKEKKQ